MEREPDLSVTVDIPRPVAEVRAWWIEMPLDYRASHPREQPHRIVTRSRDAQRWVIDTYWRVPLAPNLKIPETFTFREDGWDVEATLPLGLAQRDRFTLAATPQAGGGTRVTIDVWVRTRHAGALAALPFYRAFAKRNFPALWRAAGRLCARDAPR